MPDNSVFLSIMFFRDLDFSKFLLTDFQDDGQTVMLAPASGFYSSPELGKDQVRLAFVLESSKLKRAAKILEKALIVYNN